MPRLLTIGLGLAAGASAARYLLRHPEAAERLPGPAAEITTRAERRLQRARARVREALAAGREARHTEERALYDEYLRRTGRQPGSGTPGLPSATAQDPPNLLRRG